VTPVSGFRQLGWAGLSGGSSTPTARPHRGLPLVAVEAPATHRPGGGVEGYALAELVAQADLRRAFVEPGELARERSRCDAEIRRLIEGIVPSLRRDSGLTGKARRGESLAACDWSRRSRCRATDPEGM
jgi:hypothetical protein